MAADGRPRRGQDARGGQGAGKVVTQDMHVVSKVSKASPKLLQYCAEGKHIGEATLTCRKAGGTALEYIKIKMTDLIVSSYQTGGSKGDVIPVDQFSLNFSKIEFEYAVQDTKGGSGGTVKGQYDYKKNKSS